MADEFPKAVDARDILKSTTNLSMGDRESIAGQMTPFQTILLGVVRDLGNDVRRIFTRLDEQDRGMVSLRGEVGEVKTLQRTTNGRMLANEDKVEKLTFVSKLQSAQKAQSEEEMAIANKAVADATKGRISLPMPSRTQIWYIGGIAAFIGCDRILNAFAVIWHFAKLHF